MEPRLDDANLLKSIVAERWSQEQGENEDDTEQSVSEIASRNVCPDHLASSCVFLVGNRLAPIQPSRKELHFSGCESGVKMRKSLQLMNATSVRQRYHLLPNTTSYFKVTVRKRPGGLVPGMGDELVVDLLIPFGEELKACYSDHVRIHCDGGEHIKIPLLAYRCSGARLPKHINYGARSLLAQHTKTLSITNCSKEQDFPFRLCLECTDGCFEVSPPEGIIPSQGRAEIAIVYQPTEYSTSRGTLTLTVEELFCKAQTCNLVGSCVPGKP
ncbi:cilia- and flagella-associated protein 221-like [Sycon ciliatum]|uniref:cilia- and flagella-associated protein 221-like n=1 Tax=Sycon ciliatum TaxID=27933 RepID=UPI0031F632FF